MKWMLALALAACQRGGGDAPSVSPDYKADLTTLCDVVRLSGADQMPADQRWPIVAMWLGPHLKTEQAHDFLVHLQSLTGEPKAHALEAEAQRAGLAGCALAAEWR